MQKTKRKRKHATIGNIKTRETKAVTKKSETEKAGWKLVGDEEEDQWFSVLHNFFCVRMKSKASREQ